MFTLCVDIGNTLSKFGVFENNKLCYFHSAIKVEYNFLNEILQKYKINAAILSAVTDIPEHITALVQQNVGNFINLDHKTKVPVENKYMTKETLGNDRLAAVTGASYVYPAENLLVIDAGSAITYDIINNKSEFIGGKISPGINMRYKALNSFTSKLPLITGIDNYLSIGDNTRDSIIAGVLQGVVFEMDATIEFYIREFEIQKVILTGGDSSFFSKKLKNTIFEVQNLVMIGLNRILNYNVESISQK